MIEFIIGIGLLIQFTLFFTFEFKIMDSVYEMPLHKKCILYTLLFPCSIIAFIVFLVKCAIVIPRTFISWLFKEVDGDFKKSTK